MTPSSPKLFHSLSKWEVEVGVGVEEFFEWKRERELKRGSGKEGVEEGVEESWEWGRGGVSGRVLGVEEREWE
jgi:hypothetical protein